MLAVVQTHPIQYHAPVFRALHQQFGVPLQVIYASDFSVAGYRDSDFGVTLAWDRDLLSGYPSLFLARVADGGPRSFEEVSARGVAGVLSRLRPSAVLVCGYRPHLHRVAFFQAWRSGCAVLFRAETTDAEPHSRVATAVRRAALRMLYDRCARLLYIGERSRRHFQSLQCDASRLVFSPYCTDTASFQSDDPARARLRAPLREALGLGPNDLLILFAGKLTSKKRPDLLVQAMRRLQTSSPRPIVGLFLGDGGLRSELERAAAVEPRLRVHFVGFKNQSQLSPYYHVADLLVLPSQHSETWGVVVNEALCHGLPCVVSSAVGCAADLVKPDETGEIFDVGSETALEAALLRASRLVDRADIRATCRRLADQYSVERAAAGIAHAYRSVVPVPA